MATVYVGTVRGALGFRQLVAIKKPHAHLLVDKSFRQELVTEARLASLLHHANVVDVRDVEATEDEVSLVMDYVEGASLGELLQAAAESGRPIAPGVAVRIVLDACAGLHAAHELADERGRPLRLVHRDISPQNLLVGLDGVTRVADFGVAKFDRKPGMATTDGNLKGKLAYMAPEYVRVQSIDRRLDVFAMGVVLWEALTGERLFRGQDQADTKQRVLHHVAPLISQVVPKVGLALDGVVETALAKSPDDRFDNAAAMAAALESSARAAGLLAGPREVIDLVKTSVGDRLDERRALIRARLAHEPSVASAEIEPPAVGHAPADAPLQSTPSTERTERTPPPSQMTRAVTPPPGAIGEAANSFPAGNAHPMSLAALPTTLKSEPNEAATSELEPPTVVARSARGTVALGFGLALLLAVAVVTVLRTRSAVAPGPDAVPVIVHSEPTAAAPPPLPPQPSPPVLATPAPASAAAEASAHATRPAATIRTRAATPRRPLPSATANDGDPPPNPYMRP
jgi:serine/threonine protein kinase